MAAGRPKRHWAGAMPSVCRLMPRPAAHVSTLFPLSPCFLLRSLEHEVLGARIRAAWERSQPNHLPVVQSRDATELGSEPFANRASCGHLSPGSAWARDGAAPPAVLVDGHCLKMEAANVGRKAQHLPRFRRDVHTTWRNRYSIAPRNARTLLDSTGPSGAKSNRTNSASPAASVRSFVCFERRITLRCPGGPPPSSRRSSGTGRKDIRACAMPRRRSRIAP